MSSPATSSAPTGAAPHAHDLDAYFARIGYTGPRVATVAALRALHAHHARAIPYENLDVLLGRPIRVDLAGIEEKLVRQKRGGYCFEQNTLFAAVLRALGFRVTPCMARVRWQIPADFVTSVTHLVLLVDCAEGRFLADVGFGSMSLIEPLEFVFEVEQAVGVEPRRIVRLPAELDPARAVPLARAGGMVCAQQARLGDAWSDVYFFSLDEVPAIDVELANWFTSTHAQSRFKLNLTLARAGDRCRYAMLNREFVIRHMDGRVERREVATPEELLDVLARYFGLEFPPGTRFGAPGSAWPS
ncbi:MAG: hypothetical protein RLZZ15_2161 [Verrucomicrobiota bacterium]|jgi:N-hydroxyarylamine O-acetyltransferase